MKGSAPVSVVAGNGRVIISNGLLVADYDLIEGSWAIRAPGLPFAGERLFASVDVNGRTMETLERAVERWRTEEISDALGEGTKVELIHKAAGELVQLTILIRVYQGRPSVYLQVIARNVSDEPVSIGEVRPLQMDSNRGGVLDLGCGLESSKVYLESNNVCASVVRGIAIRTDVRPEAGNPFGVGGEAGDRRRELVHKSGWHGLIFNPSSGVTLHTGFLSCETALGKAVTRYDPDARSIQQWFAGCKYDGLAVAPGQALVSERCLVDVRADPFDSLASFTDAVVADNRIATAKDTPALWCSWYPYRLKLTEDEVLENAAVVADRFVSYGVKVMQLDYGWNHLDTPGEWSHNKERFPHGLAWLSERLRSMGLELGLWIAPFIVFEGARFFKEHPDCVICDREGRPSPWQTEWPWEPKQSIYDLDLRKPEARAFIEGVFGELVDLGVRYFKMDFLDGPSTARMSFAGGIRNADRLRDGERLRIGLSVIRDVVGPASYLLACNGPYGHALGLVDAVFDSMDIGNSYFDRDGSWDHFRTRTGGLMAHSHQQKRLWHNDPDVIYIGGNPPDFVPVSSLGEARIRATAVGLSGGPVLLGDNLAALPEERLAMYAMCLPPFGEAGKPVDLFTSDSPRIWDLKVEREWGSWHVVGLFNYGTSEASIGVDPVALGFPAGMPCLAWEFWEELFLGVQDGCFDVKVAPRTAALVLLKELPKAPTLLSTTFHVTQGGVELSDVRWNDTDAGCDLTGACHRAPGARGDLIFYVPDDFTVGECTGSDGALRIHEAGAGIWRATLEFVGCDTVAWRVRFRRG